MKLKLKRPAYAGKKLYPQGIVDWPEGISPPSDAEEMDEKKLKAEAAKASKKEKEPETLKDITPAATKAIS